MDDAKRFQVLAEIMRASHFEWRRAALASCPDLNPVELVKKYWEEVGKDTASYYLKRIDPERDLAQQVAELFAGSSQVMGEDAEVVEPSPEGHSQVRHQDCPWYRWHRQQDEDQVGCDHFLKTVVDEINAALGASLCFATDESLPGGQGCCLRRFWEEGK
jgi:hypothetical protein